MKSWFVGHPRRVIHNFWTIFLLEDCQDFMEQHFDLAIIQAGINLRFIQIAAGINLRLTMFDFSNPFVFFYFVWYVLRFLFWCSMFHHFQTKNFRLNAPNIQRFRTTTKPCCTVKEFHEPKTAKIANPISTKTKPTQNGCVIVCLKMRFLTREVCVWGMNPGVFRGFVSGYASRLSPQVQKENEGSVSGVRFRGKFRQNWTSQPYALSSTQRIQTIINTARL